MDVFHDLQYLQLLKHVIENGEHRPNRTGVDAISIFDGHMVFDLSDNSVPFLTSKHVFTRGVRKELIWFLSGDTSNKTLTDDKVNIWTEWANDDGELGPIYGQMWRAFPSPLGGTVDQISNLIDSIKNNPTDRRMIVTGWHPGLLPLNGVAPRDNPALGRQALPPCHMVWQCYVNTRTNTLDLKLYQRSADIFLGVPFNIAQYSILLHCIAQVCGLKPGRFIWTGGDIHVYENLLEQCNIQLTREPYPSPTIKLNPNITNLFDFTVDDIEIVNYKHHPKLEGKVAV